MPGSFFSHRAHRVHGGFKLTVSSPQNVSGIQNSQSVTAKEGCWVIVVRCWWLAIGVSRWSRPFPSGEGKGEGPAGEGGGAIIFLNPVCSVHLCSLWEKICHSLFVIMSFCLTKITSFSPSLCYSVFKKHLSHFVIMSFCLQKSICLSPSLCHSVFKKTSASLCHYVILSSKKHLSLFLIMSLCRPSEDTELR